MKKTIVQSFIMLLLFSVAVSAQFKSVVEADMDSTATLSGTFDLSGRTPVGVFVPTAFIGSKLFVWFSETPDSASFKQYAEEGSNYEITISKNKWTKIPAVDGYPVLRYMRFTSDSAQTASGGVTIKVIAGGL